MSAEDEAVSPPQDHRESDGPLISSDVEIDKETYLEDDFIEPDSEERTCCERFFSPIKGGSLRGAVLSFASIVFGICSLAFPKGLANMGLIPGVAFLVFIYVMNYWSLKIFIDVGRKKKILNYGLLVKECLGKNWSVFMELMNLFFCIGILMSYEFTISQFFREIVSAVFPNSPILDKGTKYYYIGKIAQMSVCMLCLQFPLSLLRDISKLQYASMAECFTVLYTALLIVIEAPFYFKQNYVNKDSIKLYEKLSLKIFDSFSIFVYAFSSHNGIFPIFDELNRPSKRRSYIVLNRAYLLEFGLFSLIGLGGFFTLIPKDEMQTIFISRKDLNMSFMSRDWFVVASKGLFFMTLHCCTAINNNIIRNSVKSLWFEGKPIPFKWDATGVFILLLVTNLITFFIEDVLTIIDILGGVCCVFVCYLGPVLCYMKTNELPMYHGKNIFAIFFLVFVFTFGITSAVLAILSLVISEKK